MGCYLTNYYLIKRCLVIAIFYYIATKTGLTVPEKMKAVVMNNLGNPDVLHIEDNITVPTVFYDQILVKVKAVGINPIDAHIRGGSYFMRPKLPAILGKEVAGYVEVVGSNVTEFKVGDRVFCGLDHGGYAEYAAANVYECYPLSENLTFAQGASLYVAYFAAYRGLVARGKIKQGDTVLIHSALGIMGTAAVQIAKHIGTCVVASVQDPVTEKLMQDAGADHVVYHTEDSYLNKILEKLQKPGFNVIMEVLPYFSIRHDKEYLVPDGKVITIGNRDAVLRFKKGVHSVSLFKFNQDEQKPAGPCILEGIERGIISPIILKEYKFEEAAEAHNHITYNNTGKGKLVFVL